MVDNICKDCGELKKHCAKGLCRRCYMRKYMHQRWEEGTTWAQSHPKHKRKYDIKRREEGKRLYQLHPEKVKKYNAELYKKGKTWNQLHPKKAREANLINISKKILSIGLGEYKCSEEQHAKNCEIEAMSFYDEDY